MTSSISPKVANSLRQFFSEAMTAAFLLSLMAIKKSSGLSALLSRIMVSSAGEKLAPPALLFWLERNFSCIRLMEISW